MIDGIEQGGEVASEDTDAHGDAHGDFALDDSSSEVSLLNDCIFLEVYMIDVLIGTRDKKRI